MEETIAVKKLNGSIQATNQDLIKLSIFTTIHGLIGGFCNSFFKKNNTAILPQEFKGYFFHKPLFGEQLRPSIAVGIYINQEGDKIVVKHWHARFKDSNYFLLKNEISAYFGISGLKTKASQSKQEAFNQIYFPNLIDVLETQHDLFLVFDFIDGSKLSSFELKFRLQTIQSILSYLDSFSSELQAEDFGLTTKKSWKIAAFFPSYFIISFLKNSKNYKLFFRAAKIFCLGLITSIKYSNRRLVHNDLIASNILINQEKISLIDFEGLTISDSVFELVSLILHSWKENVFPESYSQLPAIRKILENPNEKIKFKVFGIFLIFEHLSGSNFPPGYYRQCFLLLNYLVSLE
ncbi:MAG TPA: phosphotransferase [Candidatus Limnocylindria bacterium]|nr:phosphotransferase [Candidatus Limnocylindria bacterium]